MTNQLSIDLSQIRPAAKAALAELIIELIAASSGNNLSDIHWNSTLRQELNLTAEDCLRLIKLIEQTYNNEIAEDEPVSLNVLMENDFDAPIRNEDEDGPVNDIATVGDLVDAAYNEIELG